MVEKRISDLPQDMRRHILSFLPTAVAAKTSCLLKAWRNEFVHTSNLKFDFFGGDENLFIAFVNRVLALRENDLPLHTFSLTIVRETSEAIHANGWIAYALDCGVADLELCFYEILNLGYQLPQEIFVTNTLCKLKIGCTNSQIIALDGQVSLPNLRTLYVDNVDFGDNGAGFYNLLNGCPVLEELVMEDIEWYRWGHCTVSSQTLLRVKIFWEQISFEDDRENCPDTVSFVTPNLLYLDYSDDIAKNYLDMDLSSLVGAKVLLHMREEVEVENNENEDEEEGVDLGNNEFATDFIAQLQNVHNLYLCVDTLTVLALRCLKLPTFNNLSHLTIESSPQVVWQSLPSLLVQCPHLHTLVFRGLVHALSGTCGNMCPCNVLDKPYSCLLNSPVRMLKIFELGQSNNEHGEPFLSQIRHFLVTMPNLKMLTVYCVASVDKDARARLSSRLRGIPNKASSMCMIQVLPDNS